MRCVAALLLPSLAPFLSFGAVRWANDAGNPYRRTDFTNIQFKLNTTTAQTIVNDGDPSVAIQAALDSWNNVAYTAVHFAPLQPTSAGIESSDNQNVIAVATSAAALSVLGSATAITVVSASSDGRIIETDIILNPAVKFSVASQANSFDLQSVVAHELGHSLGANHATVVSATMFYNVLPQDNSRARLKADDASFAVDVYPGPGADQAYGTLTGIATKDGAPLPGAAVAAIDPATGVTVGGLSSLTDASFSLRLPVGNYILLASPLTGIVTPASFYNVPIAKVDAGFKAAVSGGVDNPTRFGVNSGATVKGGIAVAGGASALDIAALGKIVTNNGVSAFTIAGEPVVAQAGQALDFIVSGPGLDASITESNIRLIGPGVSLRPGTLVVENRIKDATGRSPLRFTIDVAPRSGVSSAGLFIARGSDTALLAGAIVILPSKPIFGSGSLVDAGSFKGSGVAPGELISLFGAAVGPDSPVGNSGFDPATGALPGTLGGISVTFDGIPAPLIFAAPGQVNLQVPYEVAGHASTVVVVQSQGGPSDPVTVPVLSVQPGIFIQAGTSQAIAVNQDGSVNSSSAPAPKGSVLTLYATGQGLVNPAVPTGKPAPSSSLSSASGVAVTIGGRDAKVLFGGLAPGFVGLMQVNVQVPSDSTSGAVPIQLAIQGQASPSGTTIAVQ